MEMLNFTYADLLEGADSKQRAYVMAYLENRLGPNGGILVEDASLPASMQGQEAPSWWTEAEDDGANYGRMGLGTSTTME